MGKNDLNYGVGVLVVMDGKFLCGTRSDTGEISGPGGHIEKGETPEQAAIRETKEEFGITPTVLKRIGCLKSPDNLYLPTMVFICTDWNGEPKACSEMAGGQVLFEDLRELDKKGVRLYPAFDDAVNLLISTITRNDGGPGSGNWGHVGRPGERGGSGSGGGVAYRLTTPQGGYTGLAGAYKENEARNKANTSKASKKNNPKLRELGYMDQQRVERFKSSFNREGVNVEYNKVKPLTRQLSEQEIIDKIGGGDLTDGSCASLALTYAANKLGLDVTDFRGGDSLYTFANRHNTRMLYDFDGVNKIDIKGMNGLKTGMQALKSMEDGKEYILHVGKHASVVRLHNGKAQYMELQTQNSNGWHTFTNKTLHDRFGAQRSRTKYGHKLPQDALLVDISTIGTTGFQDIMGYINTATDKQQKGEGGHAK